MFYETKKIKHQCDNSETELPCRPLSEQKKTGISEKSSKCKTHLKALSPTPWHPLKLSFLRKPPHRFDMFSTTRPCNRTINSVCCMCLHDVEKMTWHWEHKWRRFIIVGLFCLSFTSMSLWKSKRSMRCQLLPSKARTFQDWEQWMGEKIFLVQLIYWKLPLAKNATKH